MFGYCRRPQCPPASPAPRLNSPGSSRNPLPTGPCRQHLAFHQEREVAPPNAATAEKPGQLVGPCLQVPVSHSLPPRRSRPLRPRVPPPAARTSRGAMSQEFFQWLGLALGRLDAPNHDAKPRRNLKSQNPSCKRKLGSPPQSWCGRESCRHTPWPWARSPIDHPRRADTRDLNPALNRRALRLASAHAPPPAA